MTTVNTMKVIVTVQDLQLENRRKQRSPARDTLMLENHGLGYNDYLKCGVS